MPRPKNTLIRVYAVEYGREELMLRIKYPDGRVEHESSGTSNRIEANRKAALREKDLREKAVKDAELAANPPKAIPNRKTWVEFRADVWRKLITPLADATKRKYSCVFNVFEKLSPVEFLDELTTSKISDFIAAWRTAGASEATLFGSLGHLRAALAWAVDEKMLAELPIIRKPKIEDDEPTKGRAITAVEFQKMLDATPLITGLMSDHWERSLKGILLSGLRIGEAVNLSWDIPGTIRVDLTGAYPMLNIPRKAQKKRKAELYPLVREFADFLLQTPIDQQTGWVFQFPMPIKHKKDLRRIDSISKVICDIGEKSGVIVDEESGKFASAHDLRRSFGVKWSQEFTCGDLQILMRHADIKTTQKFYTRQNANVIAARIWEKGNIAGNNHSKSEQVEKKKS